MRYWAAGIVILIATMLCYEAKALPPFRKAFYDRYVQPMGNAQYEILFKQTSCNVCHVRGQSKDTRNPYGGLLEEQIGGDAATRWLEAKKEGRGDEELAAILKDLDAAFTEVEKQKSPRGGTYGDWLKAGRLP